MRETFELCASSVVFRASAGEYKLKISARVLYLEKRESAAATAGKVYIFRSIAEGKLKPCECFTFLFSFFFTLN